MIHSRVTAAIGAFELFIQPGMVSRACGMSRGGVRDRAAVVDQIYLRQTSAA